MGFEKLLGCSRAHFRGDDTEKIVLYTYYIYSEQAVTIDDYLQITCKCLILLPFPMKLDADCNSVKCE